MLMDPSGVIIDVLQVEIWLGRILLGARLIKIREKVPLTKRSFFRKLVTVFIHYGKGNEQKLKSGAAWHTDAENR